jgi:hypothetical protein
LFLIAYTCAGLIASYWRCADSCLATIIPRLNHAVKPGPAYSRFRCAIDLPRAILWGVAAAFGFLVSVSFEAGIYFSILWGFPLLRARQYLQLDANALIKMDKRPPVVFLRSFEDEYFEVAGPSRTSLDDSLETRLANYFARFGPFVAIGSPRDAIPRIGAARVQLGDDEWRQVVLSWIESAGLVVMLAGKSDAVAWEMSQIRDRCPEKLILLFRKHPGFLVGDDSKERLDATACVFSKSAWATPLSQIHSHESVRAIVFRAEGHITIVRSEQSTKEACHLAALIAHYEHLLQKGALKHK